MGGRFSIKRASTCDVCHFYQSGRPIADACSKWGVVVRAWYVCDGFKATHDMERVAAAIATVEGYRNA